MEKLQNFLFTEENSDIKCHICDSVLSIEPIEYNDLLGYVCGRKKCRKLASAKGSNSRQVLYEKVANVLKFPCIYRSNGCKTELKWGEAEQHEGACEFKNFHCPLSKNEFLLEGEDKCDWLGDYADLLSHVQENHINHFFVDSLELDLYRDFTKYRDAIYFTRIQENIVAVVISIDIDGTSLLYKGYADVSIHKFLKYSIKVCDSFRNDSTYSSKKKNVELLHRDFWDGKLDSYIKIDLKHLENFLDDPRLAILEFEYENAKVGRSLGKSTSLCGIFKTQVKEMKCFKCHRILSSPIFSCRLGHNVCNLCMKHSKTSPKCCFNFISRNNQLEMLMFLVDEPCKFNSRGCTFVSAHATIRKHEKICQFKRIKCDECNIEADDIIRHIEEKHEKKIFLPNQSYRLDRNVNLLAYMPFDDKIFSIQMNYSDTNLQLQVECLGHNQLRYEYEFCFFDTQYLCSKITWTHICYPGGLNLSKYGISKNSHIPLSILGEIFPNFETIAFKVDILKIETVTIDIP